VPGEVIAGEFLLEPQAFRVTVRDGAVTLLPDTKAD
jgi:hypothetical protein